MAAVGAAAEHPRGRLKEASDSLSWNAYVWPWDMLGSENSDVDVPVRGGAKIPVWVCFCGDGIVIRCALVDGAPRRLEVIAHSTSLYLDFEHQCHTLLPICSIEATAYFRHKRLHTYQYFHRSRQQNSPLQTECPHSQQMNTLASMFSHSFARQASSRL